MAARRQPKLLSLGSPVPDFRLPRLDGGEESLLTLARGPRVLLAFFKITCPVCQLTLPYLERVHAGGTLPVFGVSQNDTGDTREFQRDFKLSLPILLDEEDAGFPASNAFGISTVPTLFLFEAGKLSRAWEGWSKRDMEALEGQAGLVLFHAGEDVPQWKAG